MKGKCRGIYRDIDCFYNGSGYRDNTAGAAVRKVYKTQIAQKKRELIAEMSELADNAGFKITSTIKLSVKKEVERNV